MRCMQKILVFVEQAQKMEPSEEALWENKSERGQDSALRRMCSVIAEGPCQVEKVEGTMVACTRAMVGCTMTNQMDRSPGTEEQMREWQGAPNTLLQSCGLACIL